MADIAFHHGTRVLESDENPVLIRTAQSAVVALFGTDPDADAVTFPYDKPVLIKGASNYSSLASKLSDNGTLKRDLDAIFDQGHSSKLGAYVYIIRIEEGADAAETLSKFVGDQALMTGVHAVWKIEAEYGRKLKPRLFIAPGMTRALAADGVNAVNVTVGGTNYGPNTTVTFTGGGGNGAEALPIIADGVITAIAVTKPGYGYTSAPTVVITDPDATGADATATASVGTVGNPVAHEFAGICAKMGAVAFIDGPNTTDADAVVTREKYGSQRLYICDPDLLVYDTGIDGYVPEPGSARFAGVQVRVDREIGFFRSVSNQPIYGIDGVNRPITYGDQTNYLNENAVNTVVNHGEGFRTWGNRSTASEDVWKFLAVRRTADFINEAIEDAMIEFVDKEISEANLKLVIESGNAFLRTLENEGFILRGSGKVWIVADDNEPTEMAQGRVTFRVRFEPPAPMEDMRFKAHRYIQAYSVLVDRVIGVIEDSPLAVAA